MPRISSDHRCRGCRIRPQLCFCDLIPTIALQTRVVVLMHVLESTQPSNTAKLASRVLTNSEIRINGLPGEPLRTDGIVEPERTTLLLYPSSKATLLTSEFLSSVPGPFTLIVPDGKWRHTQKLIRREKSLIGIPHVKVAAIPPSEYRLRTQPNENTLCTLEAIARAIGILESTDAQRRLESILRVMVERTLWSRGKLLAANCTEAGIPDAAFNKH